MQKRLIAIGLAASLSALACTDTVETPTETTETTISASSGGSQFALSASTWDLTHVVIDGKKIEPANPVTIKFSEGENLTVTGSAGCNTYTGTWELPQVEDNSEVDPEDVVDTDEGKDTPEVNEAPVNPIIISDVFLTEKACTDSVDFAEYITLLSDVESWSVSEKGLSLQTSDGNEAVATAEETEIELDTEASSELAE